MPGASGTGASVGLSPLIGGWAWPCDVRALPPVLHRIRDDKAARLALPMIAATGGPCGATDRSLSYLCLTRRDHAPRAPFHHHGVHQGSGDPAQGVRDQRRWGPGTRLTVEEREDGVLLKAAPLFATTRIEAIFGSLAFKGGAKSLEEMDAAVFAEAARRARD